MLTYSPTPMPTPAHELETFAQRMMLASALTNTSSPERATEVPLNSYLEALKALGPQALEISTWNNFIAQFSDSVSPAGIPCEAKISFQPGYYLFSILPTNLNGTPWTDSQLQEGLHFYLGLWDPEEKKTATGDYFPQVLPNEIITIGTVKADTVDKLIKKLEAAFTQLQSLLQGTSSPQE